MLSRFAIFNNLSSVEIGAYLGAGLGFTLCAIKLIVDGHFESPCEPDCGPIAHLIVDTMTTAAATFSGTFFGALGAGIRECIKDNKQRPIEISRASPEAKEERKLRNVV